MNPYFIAMVLSTGVTSVALAQTMLPEIADTDGSGAWSLGELQAVWPDMTEEAFATVDTNADGSVDTAELTAAVDAGTVTLPQ